MFLNFFPRQNMWADGEQSLFNPVFPMWMFRKKMQPKTFSFNFWNNLSCIYVLFVLIIGCVQFYRWNHFRQIFQFIFYTRALGLMVKMHILWTWCSVKLFVSHIWKVHFEIIKRRITRTRWFKVFCLCSLFIHFIF